MKECRICKAVTLGGRLQLLQAAAFLLRTMDDKADLNDHVCQDHMDLAIAMYTDTVENQKSGKDIHTMLFALMETIAQLYLALPFSEESGPLVIEDLSGAEREELERRYRAFVDAMSTLLGPREEVGEYLDACTSKKDETAVAWVLVRAAIALSLVGVPNDTILRRVEDALPREGRG